jgi:hypothetical protein
LPWLLAVRRKKLLHQHLLLKHLLLHLQLLKLLLLRLPLLLLTPLLLLLLTPPSRLTLLLLLTLLSQLTLLRQNNHQIIFKKPVSGPVFFSSAILSMHLSDRHRQIRQRTKVLPILQ